MISAKGRDLLLLKSKNTESWQELSFKAAVRDGRAGPSSNKRLAFGSIVRLKAVMRDDGASPLMEKAGIFLVGVGSSWSEW